MSMRFLTYFTLLFLFFSFDAYAYQSTTPIKVGVRVNAPFVIQDDNDAYKGIAIELWEQVADKLNLKFQYTSYENVKKLLKAIENQEVQVAVAATTVTADRVERVDFTHPFFKGGIGIATTSQSSLLGALANAMSPAFLKAIGLLLFVLFAVGVLVWLVERRANKEQFGGDTMKGIGNGFWWSAVTMTTVGYGDKAPITFSGRLIALVWMFVSVITISGFTAAIASAFTVERLSSKVESASDLHRVRVGTLEGTTSEEALQAMGIRHAPVNSLQSGLQALTDGSIDAFVYDAPILQAAILKMDDPSLLVLPDRLREDDYAFALSAGSDLRKPLNAALLNMFQSKEWQDTQILYLGEH